MSHCFNLISCWSIDWLIDSWGAVWLITALIDCLICRMDLVFALDWSLSKGGVSTNLARAEPSIILENSLTFRHFLLSLFSFRLKWCLLWILKSSFLGRRTHPRRYWFLMDPVAVRPLIRHHLPRLTTTEILWWMDSRKKHVVCAGIRRWTWILVQCPVNRARRFSGETLSRKR